MNRMYTNEYIRSIYVYFYNNKNRVLIPEKGMTVAKTGYEWLKKTRLSSQDIWIETRSTKIGKYSEDIPMITLYRKIYSKLDPTKPIGTIAIEYDVKPLKQFIEKSKLYDEQVIIKPEEHMKQYNAAKCDIAA